MRREGPSITLTVYFDGQFWVGIVEGIEESGLSAARVVFGAEPSDEEVLKFVLEKWVGKVADASLEKGVAHAGKA